MQANVKHPSCLRMGAYGAVPCDRNVVGADSPCVLCLFVLALSFSCHSVIFSLKVSMVLVKQSQKVPSSVRAFPHIFIQGVSEKPNCSYHQRPFWFSWSWSGFMLLSLTLCSLYFLNEAPNVHDGYLKRGWFYTSWQADIFGSMRLPPVFHHMHFFPMSRISVKYELLMKQKLYPLHRLYRQGLSPPPSCHPQAILLCSDCSLSLLLFASTCICSQGLIWYSPPPLRLFYHGAFHS